MKPRFAALGAALLTVVLCATACSSAAGSATNQGTSPVSSGTVTVKVGNKVVCVITIKAGKGTCKVNTAGYTPGTVHFVGTYGGSDLGGSAGSANLTLKRAPTHTLPPS